LKNRFTSHPPGAIRKLHAKRQEDIMARRKQVAAFSQDFNPAQEAAAPGADAAVAVLEQPAAEAPARQWRADPFPLKTVNLDGYRIELQESRKSEQGWQLQIKFGSGARDDMASEGQSRSVWLLIEIDLVTVQIA
jgi:hypothetical protein